VIFDVGGTRVGFLGYLEDRIEEAVYFRSYAVGGRPGVARLERADVAADVRRLRPEVDVLVVLVHWGENYSAVTAKQERTARWLAGLGVDVVAGHHAHVVQPVERIGKALVLYSLGNYAWGAPGWPQLRIGFLLRLRIAPRAGATPGRIAGVELLPIVTQNKLVRFQPRWLAESEREWLEPFVEGSRRRGAKLSFAGTVVKVE
jgi:poly-gamma-glutamate synthesis protein (capsule biosynthesis protein)